MFNKNGGVRKNVARGSAHYVEINPMSKPYKAPRVRKTTIKTNSYRVRTPRIHSSASNVDMPIWLSVIIIIICLAAGIGLIIYISHAFGS